MNPTASFIFTTLLKIVGIVFLVILPMVSYAVYAERKVSALIQDRLARCLRNRHRRLGLEFKISVPRRGALKLANDLVRTLVRSCCGPDLSPRRQSPANGSCAISDRSWLDDIALCRELEKSGRLAAGCSNVDIVRGLCHRRLRGNKPAALRPAGSGNGVGRRLSHRI